MTVKSIYGEHARLVGAIAGALIGIVLLAVGVTEPGMDILVRGLSARPVGERSAGAA
jgi:hypothetical protein